MISTAPATHAAPEILDVAVVGGGLAGCSAARHLLEHGYRVVVYDRGRQAGGRACSNREGFDYGAPAFAADSPDFVERVQQWHEAGLVSPWQPQARRWEAASQSVNDLPTTEIPAQWVATESLAGIVVAELGQVPCQQEAIIQRVEFQDGHWSLNNDQGEIAGRARQLLLAMPVEQARRLLSPQIQSDLLPIDRPTMPMSVPQWVVMVEFEEPLSASTDLIVFNEHPSLAAAWSEARKPAGSNTKWIIHSKPVWAQTRLSTERQTIAEELFAVFKRALGSSPRVMSHRAHRWTFSRSRAPLGKGPLHNNHPPVTLCGDWSFDGSLQGAWLSGRAAGDKLAVKP